MRKTFIIMGLFKTLMDIVAQSISEANKKKENEGGQTPQSSKPFKPSNAAAASNRYDNQQKSPGEWEQYFAEILHTEFPRYKVKTKVPVTELVGNVADNFKLYKTRPLQTYRAEWGAPYTFVLYSSDAPVGVVMLGSGDSHDRNVKYLISRMYAKKLGLPYINFYTQMPNERQYVIERINKFLNA